MKNKIVFFLLIIVGLQAGALTFTVRQLIASKNTNASSSATSNLVGQTGIVASSSVFRILIPRKHKSGTAFLHKSGKVITAAHVIEGSLPADIVLMDSQNNKYLIEDIVSNSDYDLALLTPKETLTGPSLPISLDNQFFIGVQVVTWGYPEGYGGQLPLLSAGHLSGVDDIKASSGESIERWVVNAVFNSGNSGGPLIDVNSGMVIGVVVSKLSPVPSHIVSALEALKKQENGFAYTKTLPDGTKETITEGQLIAEILCYLRGQTQLGIGQTVSVTDLRSFLETNGITP
jgi:S1-C subfamily serine protease